MVKSEHASSRAKNGIAIFLVTHVFFSILLLALSCWIANDLYRLQRAESSRPYIFYNSWETNLPREKSQRLQEIEKAVTQYATAVAWAPQAAEYHCESGRLCWQAAQLDAGREPFWCSKAIASLTKAIHEMPGWAFPHFYLAQVYQKVNKQEDADREMLMAQILAPHRADLAPVMTSYWLERWQREHRDSYIPIIASRLYFLNRLDFERYGKWTLAVWQLVNPNLPAWGNIIPMTPENALAAAHIYLKQQNWQEAQEFIQYANTSAYFADCLLLEGDIYLEKGDAQQAASCYCRAFFDAVGKQREKISWEACFALVRCGHLPETLKLFKQSGMDNLENRAKIFEYAISLSRLSEIEMATYLEETERNFSRLTPNLYFFMSRWHYAQKRFSQAVVYAEHSLAQDLGNQSYLQHYYQILFALDMEDTAALDLQRRSRYLQSPEVFFLLLARRYQKKGVWHEAARWAEQAAKRRPENEIFQRQLDEIRRKSK